MNPIIRTVLAAMAGIATMMICLTGFESLIPTLCSIPPAPATEAEFGPYIANMPFVAKLAVIISYLLAGALGGYVCAWVGPKPSNPWATVALVVVFAIGGIMNFIEIPHPLWMVITGMVVIVTSPFIGYSLRK